MRAGAWITPGEPQHQEFMDLAGFPIEFIALSWEVVPQSRCHSRKTRKMPLRKRWSFTREARWRGLFGIIRLMAGGPGE